MGAKKHPFFFFGIKRGDYIGQLQIFLQSFIPISEILYPDQISIPGEPVKQILSAMVMTGRTRKAGADLTLLGQTGKSPTLIELGHGSGGTAANENE